MLFVRWLVKNLRGLERIRTAVDGFADHCLATRPRDPIKATNVKLNRCAPKSNFLFIEIFFTPLL